MFLIERLPRLEFPFFQLALPFIHTQYLAPKKSGDEHLPESDLMYVN